MKINILSYEYKTIGHTSPATVESNDTQCGQDYQFMQVRRQKIIKLKSSCTAHVPKLY